MDMKRVFFLTLISVIAVSVASAQEKWTLRQCIDHAIENNIDLRQTALTVETAEIELNTAKNSRLPSLSAGLNQGFSFGRTTSDDDNRYINTQASSTSVSASANLPVFQGFRINNTIKANELGLKIAMEGLERAKQNLELAVTEYFLNVLFNREILGVYEEQLELSKKQLVRTEELVRAEKVAQSQLFDIQATVANAEVNVISARNTLNLSLLDLSQALNLEYSPSFDIAEPDTENVVAANISSLVSPEKIYDTALGIKPQVREAEYRLQESERGIKIAQSARWPSISLGASFGDSYYYMFGQDYAQQSLADQLRLKHGESVGLNVSIPIFNKFSTRNSIRAARVSRMNYALELESVKLALYKEIHQAYQSASAAEAKYSASEKATQAASEAFRAMELKYEYGAATVYEYTESQTRLIESMSKGLQAKYEFLFSTRILDFYQGKPIEIE